MTCSIMFNHLNYRIYVTCWQLYWSTEGFSQDFGLQDQDQDIRLQDQDTNMLLEIISRPGCLETSHPWQVVVLMMRSLPYLCDNWEHEYTEWVQLVLLYSLYCSRAYCECNSETDTQRRAQVLRGHAQVQSRTSDVVSVPSVRRCRERSSRDSVLLLHQHDGRDYDSGEELRLTAKFHRCWLYVDCLSAVLFIVFLWCCSCILCFFVFLVTELSHAVAFRQFLWDTF